MTFFLATKNQHKLEELTRILAPLGIALLSERDLTSPLPEVDETGETFEENALLKARAALDATGLPSIADDSGLCVDALGGAPGVYSARFAGEPTDNEANNQKLLALLSDVPDAKRTARFVSVVACAFPDGRTLTARGECEGKIGFAPEGAGGFGYDPLFWSDAGCFGVISPAEKDRVSHRGRALEAFSRQLKKLLSQE